MTNKSFFFVDESAIKYRDVQRNWYWDKVIIPKEIFVEAYNKWIVGEKNVFDHPFLGQDDADCWSDD